MLEAEKKIAEKGVSDVYKMTPERRTSLAEGLAHVGELVRAEKAKLAELKASEPLRQLKIDQASDDVEAKKVQVKKAEDMLKLYQVVAPGPGTVLRVNTSV